MFWKRKNKLPITPEDKEWADYSLNWLRQNFGEQHFKSIQTVTPTKKFFNRAFSESQEDAVFVLERVKLLMAIDLPITLEFYSDSPLKMEDGSILTTSADEKGNWKSATGTFQQHESVSIISIETQQLQDPISLIATIAHELSHQILLGENRIQENDEYLTDLTAIFYGFGIFLGNSRFKYSAYSEGIMGGWQTSTQGYLPEQIIAYCMAWLSKQRKESSDYNKYLNRTVKKYFLQSEEFLKGGV